MPSTASEKNKLHYETAGAAGPLPPDEAVDYHEVHWTGLTAEPRDVDYVEVDAAGTRAMWLSPKGCAADRVILYAHGGGFVSGSIYTHRKLVGHLAKASGCRALLYEYAYAHEHKFPHQLDTAWTTYRWLVEQGGIRPEHIALAGDSAGAILTVGTLQRARSAKLRLPAAVMILSGWFDLALTAASFETNRSKDRFFTREIIDWLASNFMGENANRRDPLVSPLYADLAGLPPFFLQVGGDESLLDESRLFADRALAAGDEVRLDIFPGMLHTFQMMAGRAPEADDAIRRLAEWVRPRIGL